MSSSPLPEEIVRVGRDAAVGQAPTRPSVAVGFGSPADDTGVTRLDLQPEGQEQGELDLFSGTDELEVPAIQRDQSQLMGALDALNRRFGRGAVTVASATRQGAHSGYSAKQERRSPRYTTRLDEIPTARA